jgi:hypothetical protein
VRFFLPVNLCILYIKFLFINEISEDYGARSVNESYAS